MSSLPAPNAWDRPPAPQDKRPPPRAPFGGERPRPSSRQTALVLALLISFWMHAGTLAGLAVWTWLKKEPVAENPEPEMFVVDRIPAFITPRQLPKLSDAPLPPDPLSDSRKQVVELPAPATPEKANADAKHLAEHDHHVDQETAAQETALTPKVLAESFKGLGDGAEKGDAALQGKADHTGESDGAADRTEKAKPKPKPLADSRRVEEILVDDPFGIRAKPADPRGVASNDEPETSESGDASQAKLAAGNGAKVAMAGAPNNDYLPNVRPGDRTQLEAKEFLFASFWNRVQRQVEPFWVNNVQSVSPGQIQKRDYITRVNVVLSHDGSVVAVEVMRGCGVGGWDRAVLEAFREAAPFLNPPKGMIEADGKIHMDDLGFIVSLTGGKVVHMYGDPRAGKLFPGVREGYGPGH